MPIRPLLQDGAFDAETVELLSKAFDAAWDKLRTSRLRNGSGEESDTRDALARRIVAAARRGERDVGNLVADALAHLAANRINAR